MGNPRLEYRSGEVEIRRLITPFITEISFGTLCVFRPWCWRRVRPSARFEFYPRRATAGEKLFVALTRRPWASSLACRRWKKKPGKLFARWGLPLFCLVGAHGFWPAVFPCVLY